MTDPTLIAPLRELESQIAQRADWLADQAVREEAAWYQQFVRLVADRPVQDKSTCLRHVAAYRERYNVPGRNATGGMPPQSASEQFAAYSRLESLISVRHQVEQPHLHHPRAGTRPVS